MLRSVGRGNRRILTFSLDASASSCKSSGNSSMILTGCISCASRSLALKSAVPPEMAVATDVVTEPPVDCLLYRAFQGGHARYSHLANVSGRVLVAVEACVLGDTQ